MAILYVFIFPSKMNEKKPGDSQNLGKSLY